MLGKSLQRVTLSQYVSYLPFKQDIFVTWIKFRFIGDLGIDVSFSIYTVLYGGRFTPSPPVSESKRSRRDELSGCDR